MPTDPWNSREKKVEVKKKNFVDLPTPFQNKRDIGNKTTFFLGSDLSLSLKQNILYLQNLQTPYHSV